MIVQLEDQIKGMKGNELKEFIKDKFKFYKSSPEGCIAYIQECLYVPVPGVGYVPFKLWDTQYKMIMDIVTCMFDKKKDMYILLGSRQCGKTTCISAIADWLTTFYSKYNVVLIHVDDGRGKGACEEFRKLREQKTKLMYFKPTKNALTHQIFQNDSSFRLQSAQKSKISKKGNEADSGRGLSVNLLWVDEAGSVDIEKLESAVFPTASTTFIFCKKHNIPHIILLSGTANGRVGIGKRFYDLWKKVEPPLNLKNKSMGGYLLFWKDIPDKDQAWYDSWSEILTARKIHQEIDCVFYGTENSLFSDEQIQKIQEHGNTLKSKESNFIYTTPSGYISKGTFFKNIEKNKNYIIGIDVAKGRGQDYSTIEIIEYESMNHIFEFRDNMIQHDDLVKTINNLVLTILKNRGNLCLAIESNMTGSAIINDLIAMNSMYKNLIYKNTIGNDISKTTNSVHISYYDCKYGIEVTSAVRDLLINYIFRFIDKNISLIKSKELMNEIESLEIDSKGKIEGNPHDDLVFAFGHALLIKFRGRAQNILAIFNTCEDIRKDPSYSQFINMSLEGFDNDIIEESTNPINDNLFLESAGFTNAVTNLYNNEDDDIVNNISEMNNNTLSILGARNSFSMDINGNITNTQQMSQIHKMLIEQTKLLVAQSSMPLTINQSNSFKTKKERKKEKHYYSDDFNNEFEEQYDAALNWMSNIVQ